MALHLVVDNTGKENHLGNLLRAIHMGAAGEPLPQDMKDLLFNLDMDTIEDDLRQAMQLSPTEGSQKPKGNLRAV